MRDDSVNGAPKRVVLLGGRFEDRIDVRAIGTGDFVAVSVADEFSNDALENEFLIGH